MPKVKGKKARGGGKASARKTREEAGRLRPRGSEAAGRDLGNQAPQPVAIGAGQAALASLSLEQLMDAVGLRVRQEMNAQAATPYLPHQSVGGGGPSGLSASPYQPEPRSGVVPAVVCPSRPATAAVASGSNIPSGSLMSSVPPSEFAYLVWGYG